MYKEYLKNMSEYELENQIEQVLNYAPNLFSNNRYGIMFMLSIYSNILKEYTTPKNSIPKFSYSIDDSIQCILSCSNYPTYIKTLIPNNKNSFILAPLLANNHLFTCLVYKNEPNYECILVNKGDTASNYPYKKFIISEDNINNIIPLLGISNEFILEVQEIYDSFAENAILVEDLSEISSKIQKTNNCYYKEFEAGLKFAYSNSFLNNFTTPKWPISTLEMHQKYLSTILSCDISNYTKSYINKFYNVYTANKTFKNTLKLANLGNISSPKKIFSKIFKSKKSDIELVNLEKFKSAFGFDDSKDSTFYSLYNCLSLVDLDTLKHNFRFFIKVCKYYKLDEHLLVLGALGGCITKKSDDFDVLLKHFKTFFPYATNQLIQDYSREYNILGNKEIANNNFDKAIKYFNKSISLNPNDVASFIDMGIAYYHKRDFKNSLSCYKKAEQLTPNSEIILEKISLCHLSLKDDKNFEKYINKLADVNPNNPYISAFIKYYDDLIIEKKHNVQKDISNI